MALALWNHSMTTNKLSLARFDAILGLVHRGDEWTLVLAPPYAWAIDGACIEGTSFQPAEWDGLFSIQNGAATVQFRRDFGVELFIQELQEMLNDNSNNDKLWPDVLVDLNQRIVYNIYFEQPVETWVPDDWKGEWADPLDFLPKDIRKIWPANRPMPPRSLSETWIQRWIRRLLH